MAVTSARGIVNLKEKGHFERENGKLKKYTLADELPAQLSELSLETMSRKPSYTIRTLSLNDKERVLKFLRRFFFLDEPMNLAVNLLETPDARCMELEEYATSTLDLGVCVAAVDENGDYAAVLINGIARREEADYTDKSDSCPNPKFRRIVKVLSYLNNEAKMWEKLPKHCNFVMETMIASTHSAWRGRGLMRVLCEESERLAKNLGASAMRMDTTSAYSALAAERLHYKKIFQVKYSDLPFAPQPDPPHSEASVYIKEL